MADDDQRHMSGLRGVLFWYRAVKTQRDRVSVAIEEERHADALRDVHHLLVSVRHMARAVELLQVLAPLAKARERFESEVAVAKTLRDVLEHWDEYDQGEGRLQRGANRTKTPKAYTFSTGCCTVSAWPDEPVTVDIYKLAQEAERFYFALVTAYPGLAIIT